MATQEQKETLCQEHRDILECIYYVGRGIMPSYYLKKYMAHFRGKSEVTIWRYIKKLEEAKLVSQVKKFDCWFVKLSKFAVANIENTEPSKVKSIRTEGDLLRRSIYISARVSARVKLYNSIEEFISAHKHWTTLFSTANNVYEILDRFSQSPNLQAEKLRLKRKAANAISVLELQRNKSIATRRAHAIVRKSALEQIKKDKLILTKPQKKRFIMDKIEDSRLMKIREDRECSLRKSEEEPIFGVDNMLYRHIYIENIRTNSKTIEIGLMDIKRRCDVARMKEDVESIHDMFLRILGNNHGYEIKINVYCQSGSREQALVKNQKLLNTWFVSEHRKMGEYQDYKIVNMKIDEKLYGGTKILSI